jgi:hypothetical protein
MVQKFFGIFFLASPEHRAISILIVPYTTKASRPFAAFLSQAEFVFNPQ